MKTPRQITAAMSTPSYYSEKVRRILEMDCDPAGQTEDETEETRDENQENTIRKWSGDEYVKFNTLNYCVEQRRAAKPRIETVV